MKAQGLVLLNETRNSSHNQSQKNHATVNLSARIGCSKIFNQSECLK